MAPDPRCSAVKAAMDRSALSYADVAQAVGSSEQQIIAICTGSAKPTESEFQALARALSMQPPLGGSSHAR